MRSALAVQREWLLLVLAVALACGGCPSFSTLQTPRTVPEGELRFAALAGGAGALSDDEGPGPRSAQFELSARYGLSDNVDVGVKLYSLGIEAGVKWLMLRGPIDIAIAPAISYASFDDQMGTSFNAFYAHLPLMFGWNISDRVTLSFGPKLMFGYQFRSGDVVRDDLLLIDGILVGLYVSVPIRIGPAFWIAPEINAYTNVSNAPVGDITIYQGGLAFMFGGAEQRVADQDNADELADAPRESTPRTPSERAPAPPAPPDVQRPDPQPPAAPPIGYSEEPPPMQPVPPAPGEPTGSVPPARGQAPP